MFTGKSNILCTTWSKAKVNPFWTLFITRQFTSFTVCKAQSYCMHTRWIFGRFVNINFNMITLVHFSWYCLFGYKQTLVLSASHNPAIACHFLCAFARSHSESLSVSSVLLLFHCKSKGIFACCCQGLEESVWVWLWHGRLHPHTTHTLICRNSTTFLSTYLRFLFAFIFPFLYFPLVDFYIRCMPHIWCQIFVISLDIGVIITNG